MKQSDLNHLRRLLGWVRCDIGQDPAAQQQTMIHIAGKLGIDSIDSDAKARLVEGYRRAEAVPVYVRDAVKALEKALAAAGSDPGVVAPRATAKTRANTGFDPGAGAGAARLPASPQVASQGDIVQRLRHQAGHYEQDPGYMDDASLNRAAADEIDRLNSELVKLQAMDPVGYVAAAALAAGFDAPDSRADLFPTAEALKGYFPQAEPVAVHTFPLASTEPLVRYCPGCGSIGPVKSEYRDCCPDGGEARMIPAPLAEKCRDTFKIAVKALLADAAANDEVQRQACTNWRADDPDLMIALGRQFLLHPQTKHLVGREALVLRCIRAALDAREGEAC